MLLSRVLLVFCNKEIYSLNNIVSNYNNLPNNINSLQAANFKIKLKNLFNVKVCILSFLFIDFVQLQTSFIFEKLVYVKLLLVFSKIIAVLEEQ